MSGNTNIEWCDATINFWSGCTKVSPGCANCYAEKLAKINRNFGSWGNGAPRSWHDGAIKSVERLNRMSATLERRPRVFINSMSDWLDDEVPVEWLAKLLDAIRKAPHLDFLLLTKRPENWRMRMIDVIDHIQRRDGFQKVEDSWHVAWLNGDAPLNVWVGATIEDEPRKERIKHLLDIPAKIHFLSCEPLLEDLGKVDLTGIDWVICGGESGPRARPLHPDWARSLRDQCKAAGVPFMFKQWGEWCQAVNDDLPCWIGEDREFENCPMQRVGKKAAGRLLDGVEHNEFPTT